MYCVCVFSLWCYLICCEFSSQRSDLSPPSFGHVGRPTFTLTLCRDKHTHTRVSITLTYIYFLDTYHDHYLASINPTLHQGFILKYSCLRCGNLFLFLKERWVSTAWFCKHVYVHVSVRCVTTTHDSGRCWQTMRRSLHSFSWCWGEQKASLRFRGPWRVCAGPWKACRRHWGTFLDLQLIQCLCLYHQQGGVNQLFKDINLQEPSQDQESEKVLSKEVITNDHI